MKPIVHLSKENLDQLYTFKSRQPFDFNCVECGKYVYVGERFRPTKSKLDRFKTLLCQRCYNHYYYTIHPEKVMSKVENSKITKSNKHGDPFYSNKELRKITMSKKTPEEMNIMYDKMRKTMNSKPPEEKARIRQDAINTNIRLHGDPNYNNKQLREITCINRFGANTFFGSKTFESTMMRLYNTRAINRKIYYYGMSFDSTWELAIWVYCNENNIPIIRNPTRIPYLDKNGKTHKYEPDFLINGKLVEIKGKQFFRPDGTMFYPYTKQHRNSIPLTPEEKEYYDDLYERKHQCMLANGVEIWRDDECAKYLGYCDNKYPGWRERFRGDNPLNPSYWCFGFINPGHFQATYYVPIVLPSVSPFDEPDSDGFVIPSKSVNPYDVVY